MKKLLIPIILICFAVACLGFVHIDNMNKAELNRVTSKGESFDINS